MEKIRPDENNRKCLALIWSRATISREGGLLKDPRAEEIAACLDNITGILNENKYLSIFLGIRARVLDELAERFIALHPDCIVLHLGCGLDSRCERLKSRPKEWYDLDFPSVIELRRQFYQESESYHMIGSDAADLRWLDQVPDGGEVLVVAEGLTMFLTAEENISLFAAFREKFRYTEYVFDVYTDKAVIMLNSSSKPQAIQRGKSILWGLSNPGILESVDGVKYIRSFKFNYTRYLKTFPIGTQLMYKILYGRDATNRLYRIYHYRIGGESFTEEDN
ncbi:MAG: class I SAM-dependent methyltransferase [Oscillospiraceae bacterium]